ncbi:MAG: CubicO group peptidase (beta-lactamase class C family)/peptidoglycan/LPS O-acetylase OafA/YrhL [Ilumatobacter sp.]|jgi:CubicO group peptidase (beta-lactamase class C family)/peptidoglycan/LPS O-acetylase OafA/YrhL
MATTMVIGSSTTKSSTKSTASPFASPPTGAPAPFGLIQTPALAKSAAHDPKTTPRPAKQRDGFLDALRAVAIIRVVLWHAFGTPIISWVIATMPLMFFVAGSLLHNSLEARPAGQVLRSRLRRLLVPFWFFGAIVLGFLSIVHLSNPGQTTNYSPDQLLAWFVPLANPTASGWEAGWASSPLWYIRAYLWLLLLSPILLAAWRRFGMALLPLPLVLMFAGEFLSRTTDPGPNSPVWILGDLGIYSFFVLLGFAHACGAFSQLGGRELLEWLGVAATATFVAWHFFPATTGVINHSYPTLWASGIVWIAVAFLARPWLNVAPQVPVIGGILYWMTRRAMSIYLWHSPAIVSAYLLAAQLNLNPTPTLLIAMVIPIIVLAVILTGWIEDVAGGKPAEIWPTRSVDKVMIRDTLGHIVPAHRHGIVGALAAGCAATLVVLAAIAPMATADDPLIEQAHASTNAETDGGLALPPPPSGRPDPQAAVAGAAANVTPAATPPVTPAVISPAPSPELTALTEQWLATSGISGVRVAVVTPDGSSLFAGSGTNGDGSPMNVDSSTAVTSITKTMTGAITMQLVDEGLLALDAPMTSIPGAGEIPGGATITIRQLLNHSSGLAPYQETPTYDSSTSLDPLAAVQLALTTGLQWAPGSKAGYSNSGFLTLGLLIENATGQDYETVLAERILEPYGLFGTSVDTTPRRGWIGDSAGGVASTVNDLAAWGAHLYRDGDVVSPGSLAQMTAIDESLYAGLGTFPVCPCTPNGDGTVRATSYGHNGGSVALQYSPADDVVIAVGFSESFWLGGFGQSDVYEFIAQVRAFANS